MMKARSAAHVFLFPDTMPAHNNDGSRAISLRVYAWSYGTQWISWAVHYWRLAFRHKDSRQHWYREWLYQLQIRLECLFRDGTVFDFWAFGWDWPFVTGRFFYDSRSWLFANITRSAACLNLIFGGNRFQVNILQDAADNSCEWFYHCISYKELRRTGNWSWIEHVPAWRLVRSFYRPAQISKLRLLWYQVESQYREFNLMTRIHFKSFRF